MKKPKKQYFFDYSDGILKRVKMRGGVVVDIDGLYIGFYYFNSVFLWKVQTIRSSRTHIFPPEFLKRVGSREESNALSPVWVSLILDPVES